MWNNSAKPKRLDLAKKQRQHAREGILFGECQLTSQPKGFGHFD
jgi:hypothetical protein